MYMGILHEIVTESDLGELFGLRTTKEALYNKE